MNWNRQTFGWPDERLPRGEREAVSGRTDNQRFCSTIFRNASDEQHGRYSTRARREQQRPPTPQLQQKPPSAIPTQHMWNNDYNPPPSYGPPPSFPSPGGFAPPDGRTAPGYNPGYAPSYAPPSGPPGMPQYGNAVPYAPPAPTGFYEMPSQVPHQYPPPGSNAYPPPPLSPRPPPISGEHSSSNAPPAPRSTYPGQQVHHSGYPGQQAHHNGHPGQHAYPSPAGPPPPSINRPMGGPPPMPPSHHQTYGPTYQDANNQQQQHSFQYSQCNGKKKALCIGINYIGQKGQLQGCINDANNVKRFLCGTYGYREDDIVILTEDSRNPRQMPTKQNMLDAMRWLVRNAQPNDSLFFHYSGHGGQTKDLDGDEADGYDEVIYPVDFQTNGHIVDDDMFAIMVRPLPAGCRLTAIFDSCHSGSSLDLPFMYSTEGKIKEPNMTSELGHGLMGIVSSYAKKDMGGVLKGGLGLIKTAGGSSKKVDAWAKQNRSSPADVISWSGCKDSQTSADTVEAGMATGAMSFAFISCLSANRSQSYQQLLTGIRQILSSKYSQKPQLSSSHPIDTSLLFMC